MRRRIRNPPPRSGRRPNCPKPTKKVYATEEAAETQALMLDLIRGRPLHAYLCSCGWWHLATRKKPPGPA